MSKAKQKSKGHVNFWDEREFVEINGSLYETKIDNPFDPEGYRQGLRQTIATRNRTKQQWLSECQELIDSAWDGEYYDSFVHPEDREVFKRPNPSKELLELYVLCKNRYGTSIKVEGRQIKAFSLAQRIHCMWKDLCELPLEMKTHFRGEYKSLFFPVGCVDQAIKLLSAL